LRLEAANGVDLALEQAAFQFRRRRLEEAGCELVQQATDLLGHFDEHRALLGCAAAHGV
jgi:hypothetical protein